MASTGRFDPEREHLEEQWAKKEFGLLQYRLQGLSGESRGRLQADFTQRLLQDHVTVPTPHGELRFTVLGKVSSGRAHATLTKQPATIAWIDTFPPGSVFWDIGANVGVYSLYAALRPGVRVVAFEPAAVNYFLLAANCEINGFDDRVDCVLAGVSGKKGTGRIEVSQFEPAASFSFSGKDGQGHRGRQSSLLMPIDTLVDEFGLAAPNYIKIDVPGPTDEILAGAVKTLRRPDLEALHVELRPDSKSGRRMMEFLAGYGFHLDDAHAHGGSADVTFVRKG